MIDSKELLLGKQTPVVEVYSPELLYPIPRATARTALGLTDSLPFAGVDLGMPTNYPGWIARVNRWSG